jgi:hypothetical protein
MTIMTAVYRDGYIIGLTRYDIEFVEISNGINNNKYDDMTYVEWIE